MTADVLSAFLGLPDHRMVVEEVIAAIGQGGASPATVRVIEGLIPGVHPDLRAWILELSLGTARARRLGKAHSGWLYTNRMAEQCTHPEIAAAHAARFALCRSIVEICTGAGHDTLELARRGATVISYEADPAIALLTTANLQLAGLGNVEVRAEAWSSTLTLLDRVDGIWADPSRRSVAGRCSRTGSDYTPPIDRIIDWVKGAGSSVLLGIKIGPGDRVSDGVQSLTESEYIGFGRECRERVLWMSNTDGAAGVRTVHLVDRCAIWKPLASEQMPTMVDLDEAQFVAEPHAAVIAAGVVTEYFAEIGVRSLDPMIAYGISAYEPVESPFHETFRIEVVERGLDRKRIRTRLRQLGWGGGTEFKKRGWDGDPEDLRPLLPENGPAAGGVVLLARVGTGHLTIYAHRVGRNDNRPMESTGR